MKTRAGFVSNSSSTSFIIELPQKPTDADDVQRWIFPNTPYITTEWDDECQLSTADAAKIVFDDLKDQAPLTLDQIINEVITHVDFDYINRDSVARRIINDLHIPIQTIRELAKSHDPIRMHQIVNQWIATIFKNLNHVIYIVEYGDNHGNTIPQLENPDAWKYIPHIALNNH